MPGMESMGSSIPPDTFFNLVIQFLHLGVQLRVEFQQDGHFLEKEAGRTANGVLCQGLEFDKVIEREVSPRDFTKGFIRACVHAGDSFRRLVVVKDVQRCGGELSLGEKSPLWVVPSLDW